MGTITQRSAIGRPPPGKRPSLSVRHLCCKSAAEGTSYEPLLRGLHRGRGDQALAGTHHPRLRRYVVHVDDDEHQPDPFRRPLRQPVAAREMSGERDLGVRHRRRHERERHQPERHRQSGIRKRPPPRADLSRRHHLRRDRDPREDGIEVEARPRRHLRRDARLEPEPGARLVAAPAGADPETALLEGMEPVSSVTAFVLRYLGLPEIDPEAGTIVEKLHPIERRVLELLARVPGARSAGTAWRKRPARRGTRHATTASKRARCATSATSSHAAAGCGHSLTARSSSTR